MIEFLSRVRGKRRQVVRADDHQPLASAGFKRNLRRRPPWQMALLGGCVLLGVLLVGAPSAAADEDTEPPKLVGFSIAPSSVNVSSVEQSVSVTAISPTAWA
jgi:hypothetical protein